MVELSKSNRNINQNELKGNLWINMLAGLTCPQIFFKKHLKHGLTNKGVELMLPKLFPENDPLPAESLWDPAVTESACGQSWSVSKLKQPMPVIQSHHLFTTVDSMDYFQQK